jgi:DNA-binding IclR family transcriptional regulator
MVDLGHRNLAHCTACGKVLLAALAPAELDRRLGDGPLAARTPASIADPARLRGELAAVRARGYAENIGESANDTASVAAPIHDHTGRAVAAISVAGPLSKMGEATRCRYASMVLATAGRIGEQLGYRRPHLPPRRTA